MKVITRPAVAALLLLIALTTTTVAQQKRQAPAKPQPKPAAAPVPPPTFDTLVPAYSYVIYGEVRGVGQLIRSSSVNEALEPILKLAGPPKEFRNVVKWLHAHADEVMTSRLLVATWPIAKNVPEAIVAIEFASAEEAAKFASPLNTMLTGVIPPLADSSPQSQGEVKTRPGYHMQQAGSLIVLTPKPLTLEKLKRAGNKPLTEDINFRTARNRFTSEQLFVFIDVKTMEREAEERRKNYEEQQRKEAEQVKREQAAAAQARKAEEAPAEPAEEEPPAFVPQRQTSLVVGIEKEPPAPDPTAVALSMIGSAFFRNESTWPDGIAFALTLENDSFDLRALMVNEPGQKSDTVPFMPMLIPGPPIVPEAPNILPADTQLFATVSLDLPQIYTNMSRPRPNSMVYRSRGNLQTVEEVVHESPFAAIEKKLNMNLKDDLLPLLGSEIAMRLPLTGLEVFGLPKGPSPQPASKNTQSTAAASPVVLISLRDREAVRALMPKIVEALGFKGANSFAQTERKEDTEIVSYLNFFSYAFIGNFLVLSTDATAVRHVVDSYLKHETLASDGHFRNSTRWQPRPAHGQLYISPALMEGYRTWAEQTKQVSEPARAILMQLTSGAPQPITYSLSNEGLGPLHEVHLPKNLVLMAVAGLSGSMNPPRPEFQGEQMATGLMMTIAHTEEAYKEQLGSYATLEQLVAAKMIPKDIFDQAGYKFDIFVTGDKFEVFAVPKEYGKNGKMSYFIDQTKVLRGADRNGTSANSSDPPVN